MQEAILKIDGLSKQFQLHDQNKLIPSCAQVQLEVFAGELTALVLISNFAEADAIGDRLEESGLGVTLGQARQSGDRVLGEFVIGAGGGS